MISHLPSFFSLLPAAVLTGLSKGAQGLAQIYFECVWSSKALAIKKMESLYCKNTHFFFPVKKSEGVESTSPCAPQTLSSESLLRRQPWSPLHCFEDSGVSLQSRFLPSVFWFGELSHPLTKERSKFPGSGDVAIHSFRSFNKAAQLTKEGTFLLTNSWQVKVPSREHRNATGTQKASFAGPLLLTRMYPRGNAASWDGLICGNVPKLWIILSTAQSEAVIEQSREFPPHPEQGSACCKGSR